MTKVLSAVVLTLSAVTSLHAENVPPPTVVPEPSTLVIMGAGVVGAVLFARSRKTRK